MSFAALPAFIAGDRMGGREEEEEEEGGGGRRRCCRPAAGAKVGSGEILNEPSHLGERVGPRRVKGKLSGLSSDGMGLFGNMTRIYLHIYPYIV